MRKRTSIRLVSLLLSALLLAAYLPAVPASSAAGSLRTLWDMETLPADLVGQQLAVPVYDTSDYVRGNVTLTSAAGKGRNGSKALAVTQNGTECWADIFYVYPERDYGAHYDLTGAEMLWFWADATEFGGRVSLDLRADGRYPYIGDCFYTCPSGSTKATENRITDAWDGIHGRINLNSGFIGWVGVPLTSFVTVPNNFAYFVFFMSVPAGSEGKTLYLDDFCAGTATDAPAGVAFTPKAVSAANPDSPVWDMEALPDDLIAFGLVSVPADAVRRNVRALAAAGRGFNGSAALRIMQYGRYSDTDILTFNFSKAEDFVSDWSTGDMLLFWADVSEFDADVTLKLSVNTKKTLAAGTAWHCERSGLLVKAGAADENGAITLPAGFRGWAGLPLTGFTGGVHTVSTLKLQLSYAGNDVLRKSLYLDEFRVITGNRLPGGLASALTDTAVLNAGIQPIPSNYLNILPADEYQTMAAYGASDCWWTNAIGMRKDIANTLELLYGSNGIALNNYRLNIGGSVQYTRSDSPTPFSRSPLSPLNEAGELDIARNAGSWNAYSALLQLISGGKAQIDDLTLFMNTPPSSYMSSGITWGDTLRADKYNAYARYVADVVAAYNRTGLTVKYVSPVNEPLMGYWHGNHSQEGCDYESAADIANVAALCIQQLQADNSPTKVSGFDFNTWSAASKFLDAVLENETVAANIDHICGHDYGYEKYSYRSSLASRINAYGLGVHMTEWAMARSGNEDNMDTALELAETLQTDLCAMNADTWSWWLGAGGGGASDALVYYSTEDNVISTTKRLWALGNYSRFTVGATRIGTDSSHLTSGLSAMAFKKGNTLIYTLINKNNTPCTLSLAGLPAGASGLLYETSARYNCELRGTVLAENGIRISEQSILTVVFENTDFSAVSSTAAPAASAGGRMLDMEGIAVSEGFGTHRPELVSAAAAPGKGADGSTAIALQYNVWDDATYWDTAFELRPAGLGGAGNWSGGDLLWFWLDASQFANDFYLQVDCSDGTNYQLPIGSTYYLWNGSGAPAEAQTVKTWEGATYGRLRIPAGYCGYAGIPMSGYGALNRGRVSAFSFYFEPERSSIPATLWLDEFWLTPATGLPELPAESAQPAAKAADIFDMESLQEDLSSNTGFATWGGNALGTYVDAVVGTENGLNGSYALGYRYLRLAAEGNGQNALQISTNALNGFVSDWSGADTFWFWVDATEFSASLQMGVQLNWSDLSAGQTALLWSGGGGAEPVSIPIAYANVARVQLPAGYSGFVGLPLSGYTVGDKPALTDIHTVNFYFEPAAADLPATLWLDELWVTPAGELPDISFTPVQRETYAKEIWDIDAVSGTFRNDTIHTHYGDPLSMGVADAVIAAQKGYNQSAGFGYVLDGVWSTAGGDNNLNFTSLSAVGIDGDWSSAAYLWFWADTAEFSKQLRLRILLNWGGPAVNTEVFFWDGNPEAEKTSGGRTAEAYYQAGFGSIPIPAGYQGFIAVPLSAFAGLTAGSIGSLILHIDADGADTVSLPKTLWLDEFWVTDADSYPAVEPPAARPCEHSYAIDASASVAPSCTEPGKNVYVCSGCCDSYEETLPASGHHFAGGVCTVCGAKDPAWDPCEGYTDINRKLWYHSAADYVIQNGYMGSTKTDALTFEPNTKVSRAMVASIMYRIAGSPAVTYKASFTDVKAGKWFTASVEWAAQTGLAAGKGDGKFDPNGNVTRQELAVFMYKLAKHLGRAVTASADLEAFPDAKTVPSWARNYLQWAVAAGLISGKSSGGVTLLAPADTATRAEFASIIMRFMESAVS